MENFENENEEITLNNITEESLNDISIEEIVDLKFKLEEILEHVNKVFNEQNIY